MVSMLTLGAGILMVNVTAYRIHGSYGYHYHHATRLQAAQEAIAQGERRKKLVQSVVGVGAGPTSQAAYVYINIYVYVIYIYSIYIYIYIFI